MPASLPLFTVPILYLGDSQGSQFLDIQPEGAFFPITMSLRAFIFWQGYVEDIAMSFTAIGDATDGDKAPLQVQTYAHLCIIRCLFSLYTAFK